MNGIFEALVEMQPTVNPGDYIQDGLLYCGNCHTPKQSRLDLLGATRTVVVACKCGAEQFDREQAKIATETRYARAMGNPATALDLRVASAHCDERIKRYLSKWPEMQQKNIGLLLWGDVGTGKTSSAAYVVEKLKEQKIPCLMTSISKLADTEFGKNIGSLRMFDLLVLDDIGTERQKDYMLEKGHEIIDDRVNAKKPMILTTNLSMEEMKNQSDLRYRRIYDRILSVCVPIRFQGVSHRAEQKEDILAEARRFLE